MTKVGADENPRYEKRISFAVDYFNTYDLDAFFLVTNAPGLSAFNRAERRMVPLKKELSGVLLVQHEHCGAHLDDKGNTIDPQFELKNFEHVGKISGEISSGMVIDGYPLIAEASEIVNYVREK